jgi:hypothetical protein
MGTRGFNIGEGSAPDSKKKILPNSISANKFNFN